MAITATVERFGMTFSDAYHKVSRLTYESFEHQELVYPTPEEYTTDEDGNVVIPSPSYQWFLKKNCGFEVETYASSSARASHAEPIYRTHFGFEPNLDAESSDIISQAYEYLKAQEGYEDAVDC